jgi:acylphosphatase
MESRRLVITGLVQGVGFRYHMVAAAKRLNIAGWVRNRTDGSVEAVISGSAERVAAMIDWSRQGPPAAQVERVFVEQTETSTLQGFNERPTK